jgi:hypothetical protein
MRQRGRSGKLAVPIGSAIAQQETAMFRPTALPTTAAPGPTRPETASTADGSPSGVGWYESSWELIRGLEVIELLLQDAGGPAAGVDGDGPTRTAR